jgi:hypothetical protein
MSEVTVIEPGAIIGIVAVSGGLLCALTSIVMCKASEIHRANLNYSLKKDMLERGMTPEEMRLVLEAGAKTSEQLCKGPVEAEV